MRALQVPSLPEGVKKVPGFCTSRRSSSPDHAYRITKKAQISAPTKQLFSGGTLMPGPTIVTHSEVMCLIFIVGESRFTYDHYCLHQIRSTASLLFWHWTLSGPAHSIRLAYTTATTAVTEPSGLLTATWETLTTEYLLQRRRVFLVSSIPSLVEHLMMITSDR